MKGSVFTIFHVRRPAVNFKILIEAKPHRKTKVTALWRRNLSTLKNSTDYLHERISKRKNLPKVNGYKSAVCSRIIV